jgi:hypothetical protein
MSPRKQANADAARAALELRLAANRIATSETDLPAPLVNLLLALKERPCTARELAGRLELDSGYVRSTLRRYLDGGGPELIEVDSSRRYRLTLMGHHRVNAIAAAGLAARKKLFPEPPGADLS